MRKMAQHGRGGSAQLSENARSEVAVRNWHRINKRAELSALPEHYCVSTAEVDGVDRTRPQTNSGLLGEAAFFGPRSTFLMVLWKPHRRITPYCERVREGAGWIVWDSRVEGSMISPGVVY